MRRPELEAIMPESVGRVSWQLRDHGSDSVLPPPGTVSLQQKLEEFYLVMAAGVNHFPGQGSSAVS